MMKAYDDNELEQRLRELPAPAIPPALEAKLLARLPTRVENPRHAQRPRPSPLLVTLGAVAASAAVALVFYPRDAGSPTVARDVLPDLIIRIERQHSSPAQETRLCDIIPPLPQSS